MYIQMQVHLSLLSNAPMTAGGRARLSSARRRTPSIAARRAEDRRALPAMTDRLPDFFIGNGAPLPNSGEFRLVELPKERYEYLRQADGRRQDPSPCCHQKKASPSHSTMSQQNRGRCRAFT